MADQFVQVPADSTGKKIDTSELTVGANTVERQRVVVGDPTSATALAAVKAASTAAAATDPALVVAVSPNNTIPVSAASLPLPAGAALDATLTGGTQQAQVKSGAKGTSAAALVTSTAEGANNQALDVQIWSGGATKDPTAIRTLTSADVVTAAQGTAAAVAGAWPVKVTDGTNTMPTGDVAARAGFEKITDGTNTAAVKAASTVAAATDPAVVVTLSPNVPLHGTPLFVRATDGTNDTPAMDAVGRAGFQKVTDGTNVAAVKAASTAPAGTDPAAVVVLSPNGAGSHYAVGVHSNPVTLMSTGLNALANNGQVLSAAIENATSHDLYADFEMLVTFGVAPTAGKTIDLYVVRSVDGGTNYEDADSTSILPASGFVGSFSVRAVATAQRMIIPQVVVPPSDFKVVLVNNATGQAFAATGNTLRANFYRWAAG